MIRTYHKLGATVSRIAWLVAFFASAANAWHVAPWITLVSLFDTDTATYLAVSALALGVSVRKVIR